MSHPALVPPDGQRHRGGPMVAADIDDPRVLQELSRRYRETGNHEYFLRLLDHYHFSNDRLRGLTLEQVEQIFGPGKADPHAEAPPGVKVLIWSALPDSLVVHLQEGRVAVAMYIMGF